MNDNVIDKSAMDSAKLSDAESIAAVLQHKEKDANEYIQLGKNKDKFVDLFPTKEINPINPKLVATFNKTQLIDEVLKCKNSPQYFIGSYIRITHPNPAVGEIPFMMYPFQQVCVQAFIDNKEVIVNKARQLGMSTVVGAYCLWKAIFQQHQKILIVAINQRTAREIFNKIKGMYQTFRRVYPAFKSICESEVCAKFELKLTNGSTVIALPRTPDVFRSHAVSLAVIDEAAFITDLEEVWAAASPALQHGGSGIVISTPSKKTHMFYTMWEKALSGENGFFPVGLPWQVHPDHDLDWYEEQKARDMNEIKTRRELDCIFTDTEGDEYFSKENLLYVENSVSIPRIDIDYPDMWIWEEPIKGHRYIISADCSRGLPNSGVLRKREADKHGVHIVDIDTGNVAVEYCGYMLPEALTDFLVKLAQKYNNALICPENQSGGIVVLNSLFRKKYNHVYSETLSKNFGTSLIYEEDFLQAGFLNSSKAIRELALAKLTTFVSNEIITIRSERFIEEMKTFVWKKERAQAESGSHDDLIMSMAIACFLLDKFGDKQALLSKSKDKSIISGYDNKTLFSDIDSIPDILKRGGTTLNNYAGYLSGGAPEDKAMRQMPKAGEILPEIQAYLNWDQRSSNGITFPKGISLAEKKHLIEKKKKAILSRRKRENPAFAQFIETWGTDFYK